MFVKENIVVNWDEENHHGIYRVLPKTLDYTGKDGVKVRRDALIKYIDVDGEQYYTESIGNKKRIKIGDADKTVDLGLHKYVISYVYDMGKDPFKNGDEFIFHAFGDYWGTLINNASIQINMPKNFDNSKINFFFDKYRKKPANEYVDYSVDGKKINIRFNDIKYKKSILMEEIKRYCNSLSNFESGSCYLPDYYTKDVGLLNSLTVDIELDEGYFKTDRKSIFMFISIFIIALYVFYKWLKYGRDFKNESFYAESKVPENFDPAEVGYIYGRQTGKKLTIALIISLATKGYIKITQSKDGIKRTIVNLLYTNEFKDRVIKISKQKEIYNNLNKIDKKWINYLFSEGNEKIITKDFDYFYRRSSTLIKKGYIKIESDTNDKYNYYLKEIAMKKSLKPLSETEKIVYDQLFENGKLSEKILNEDKLFYTVFAKVSDNLEFRLKDKFDDRISIKERRQSFILLGVSALIWVFCSNPLYKELYYFSIILLLIILLFSIIMSRKTKYGVVMESRVQGFKKYLETTQKNKLEENVSKNPEYYYEILPYAYVLGVTKKWISYFENIPIPKRDNLGNIDFTDVNSFNSFINIVDFTGNSSDSSGGCSSCGGGCSSCGGGCSSCGGGGSW